MAYQVGPNGLPMVRGLALPLSPEQMAAAGLSPEQAPGGIPMPGPNPYGGLPANAVAGPGGAPVDMGGGADDAIRMAAGSGQGPQLSQSDLARLTAPQSADRSHAAPPSGFGGVDDSIRLAAGSGQGPELTSRDLRRLTAAPPSLERAHTGAPSRTDQLLSAGSGEHGEGGEGSPKLLPTVGEAQRAAEAPSLDPGVQAAMEWELKHGAGGGPRRLAEMGETQKYTQYGTVPEELQKDIAARQEAVDKERAAVAESAYTGQADALARQREVIAQQEKDAAAAERQRQLVNQRIERLQAASDAQEAALTQATPKQASEFFGGSDAARMFAALAVTLGASVQVSTGHNPGAEIVNGAIDRWVNDQKQAYDAAKDKATLANNAYKNALEIFGTPEAAESQIRLQALAAKNAMATNIADQTKNDQVRQNALLMIQNDQLTRQQLRAQAIQQAGMKEVESKLQAVGGPGSGGNPYVKAAKAGAEYRTAARTAADQSNEDIRTGIEAQKAQASGAQLANKAAAAAEAAARFREKASTFAGRAPGAGKGELEAARADAEAKYTAYLVASGGASARNAAEIASKFYAGKGDAIRGPSADAALDAHIKTLRGNEIRARAAHAAGITPESSEPEGEPE